MSRLSAVAVVMLSVVVACFVSPLFAQPDGPPAWIKQIDPTKYILLAADIKPPFAYGTDAIIHGDARGVGIDDGQGNVTEQVMFFMYAIQTVKLAQPFANTAATAPPTPMRWEMDWTMTVGIYQNEDVAKAAVRTHYLSAIGPFTAEDENCLNDQRLRNGRGAAGAMGRFVRYRNLILKIDTGQVLEVKGQRDPIDAALWNGAHGNAQTHQQDLIAALARLWLDKVAGPDRPDLRIESDHVYLRQWSAHATVEREPASDQQYVSVWVTNSSETVAATGVHVELLVRLQGAEDFTPIGRPMAVPDIPPKQSRPTTFYWDLGGRNVENATLRAIASRPGHDDMDPVDNQCDVRCSIYFAHNGTIPFRGVEDAYSFNNYGFQGHEVQEMVEGILATVINVAYSDPEAGALLQRLLFPQTYLRLRDYLTTSVNAGVGGHCYGMAATAGLYFMDSSLRPGGGRTCDMSQDASSANINIYQRAQLVPVVRGVLTGEVALEQDVNSINCLNTTRNALRDSRRPVMIAIFGSTEVQEPVTVNGQQQMQTVRRSWGHALLAYKLVEVDGRVSAIYVYDPNLPPRGQWGTQDPSSAFNIHPTTGGWGATSDMTPLYNGLNAISARAVVRELSLAEANTLVPVFKKMLADMTSWFDAADKFMATLRCPADVVFTDSQGRRTGMIGDQTVNEIPGAEVRAQGEVEIYILPADQQYQVSISGTGSGEASLDIIRAESGTRATLISFQGIPTTAGSTATATMLPGARLETINAAGQTFAPKLVGSLDGDKAGPVTDQRPPTTATGPPTAGQLVVCRGIQDGKPQGVTEQLPTAREVWCHATYTNVPQATEAECVWKREGQEVRRTPRTIGGNGWVAFALMTDGEGGLQPGSYTVSISAGGLSFGTRQFTIGTSQPGQTPSQPPSGTVVPVRGPNLLGATQLPAGLSVPAGTTARAFRAPFSLGRPFYGSGGETFIFSGDAKAGQILYSPSAGTAHTCCESSVLQGGNWRGGVYRDGKFVVSVDYAPAAGNSTSGVFELTLDGASRRWALQRDYGGLGDLIQAPQGGLYFTEFETGENIYHLAGEGQAETPVVAQGWPGGIVRLGYDARSAALYGLNWGREWWGGSVNGVFKLTGAGEIQLVAQAPAGTTFDDMAISPGGAFVAGPYVLDVGNGRVLQVVPGGSPVPVISGLTKPQSMGFRPTSGEMIVVCDGGTVLWIGGPDAVGGDRPPFYTPVGMHRNRHISLDKEVFSTDEEIELRWFNVPPENPAQGDWIAVVPAGSPDEAWGNWWYTGGQQGGTRVLGKLAAGDYEVRVYYNWPAGGYNVQSRLRFAVR